MGFGDFVEGVGNAFHDAGASVFGYDTVAEKEANQQAEQAAKTGEQERDRLAKENRALKEGVSGYDQPAISQCVNWSSYSHEQIFNTNRDTIDEGRADEVGTAWNNLGKRLRERGAPFEAKLKEIIGGGWQGEAAEQAKTVGEPVKMWMEYSGNAFEMTGNKLKEAASAAGQVKQTVPEPQGHDWGRTAAAAIPMGLIGGGGDALAQMEERKQAEKGAQEAMGRIYSPTFTNVDAHMPQYQKPDGTVVEPPPARPPEETDWGKRPVIDDRQRIGVGPGDSGTGIGGGVGSGGGGGGSGSGGGGFGSGGGGGVGGGGYGGGSGGGGGYTPPAGTDSAWSKPPTAQPGYGNLPPAPGPSSGGGNPPGAFGAMPPGGFGGGGAGGAGRAGGMGGIGRGGAGTGGVSAGGRAGTGGLGAGGAAGVGAAGAGRGAGAGGRGGMAGMGGGAGRGGQQGQDDEHERPSWLEEQDDVWMNDMPKTAPPVLGE
ncbi:PPE domain-containing protein [Saccharopolyspora erythraea]|uniref:PPE domain-containing protein n=1 Tax=Saccharopolyspora erythraea TaxID=1836 RepID=UPI001BA745AC|nr:PPE domain-containing protein [Saccharopolyspora erythraea]QUH00337.1 PPE domain-containing protein [Saccharopolyspora erythraea]